MPAKGEHHAVAPAKPRPPTPEVTIREAGPAPGAGVGPGFVRLHAVVKGDGKTGIALPWPRLDQPDSAQRAAQYVLIIAILQGIGLALGVAPLIALARSVHRPLLKRGDARRKRTGCAAHQQQGSERDNATA